MKGDTLSEKQRRFVEAYCGPAMGNATDAARRAGYAHPGTQGPRLLENVGVSAAIKEMTRPRRDAAIASTQELLEILTTIARGGVGDGDEKRGVEDKDRIAAIDKLFKVRGLYSKTIRHEGSVPIDLSDIGTESLEALVAKLRDAGAGE